FVLRLTEIPATVCACPWNCWSQLSQQRSHPYSGLCPNDRICPMSATRCSFRVYTATITSAAAATPPQMYLPPSVLLPILFALTRWAGRLVRFVILSCCRFVANTEPRATSHVPEPRHFPTLSSANAVTLTTRRSVFLFTLGSVPASLHDATDSLRLRAAVSRYDVVADIALGELILHRQPAYRALASSPCNANRGMNDRDDTSGYATVGDRPAHLSRH
ncbi:hypothetical protein GGX14DRAFT_655814, partial [Mycena pura]